MLHALDVDIEQYDSIISGFYEAAQNSKLWGDVLEKLQELFRSNYVTLILRTPNAEGEGLMIAVGDVQDQETGKVRYMTYKHAATPFVNLPADRVFTVEDLMTEKEWRSSPYFNNWCKHHGVYHVLGADISTPEGGKLRFRITRDNTGEKFSENDRKLCEAILPHLRRALIIHNSLERSESMGSLYSDAINHLSVATIVLDENCKIIDKNLMATEIFNQADGLKVVGGRLEASYPSDNKRLHQLIRETLARTEGDDEVILNSATSLSRPSGQVDLGVVVQAITSGEWAEGKGQPSVVVYVRDAVGESLGGSTEVAQKLYGLTPAEASLACVLANGLSLDEAAEELGIRKNTARAHLRSIFSKTGVRRQTELVRIMLNSVAMLT